MHSGILLTTKAGDQVNSMVIGWGTLGSLWGKSIFIAYVRDNRFTRTLLDENPEFTVNVPVGKLNLEIMTVCGAKSGRNMDKLSAVGLTPVAPEVISVPAIKELPLTLECRVVYRDQPSEPHEGGVQSGYPMSMDEHICYYGEIVAAYIIEEA
ncbi:MAG: flavin reductase family protein [Clostridia bacterium]|nr:flavin reductase family protein [Clostridia bacterium]